MLEGLQRVLVRMQEINGMLNANETMPSSGGLATGQTETSAAQNSAVSAGSFEQILSAASMSSASSITTKSAPVKGLEQYEAFINEASSKYGVDKNLIKAVIVVESGGRARAVSKAGARGLMQLMPATARGLGVLDSFDPKQNIDGGTKYLKSLLDRFSDIRSVIAAYNAGPGAVRKYGGIPPYTETQKYVSRVLGLYEGYKGA